EIEGSRICDQSFQTVRIFPFALRATVTSRQKIIGDLIFEKFRFRSAFDRPVVPLPVQIIEIEKAGPAKFHTRDFISGRPCAGVIPWADNQKMLRARLW